MCIRDSNLLGVQKALKNKKRIFLSSFKSTFEEGIEIVSTNQFKTIKNSKNNFSLRIISIPDYYTDVDYEEDQNSLERENISKENLIIDPGIGFSKDINQNLEILKNLDEFKKLNLPILIGASRKRFIGEILNEENPKERDVGTLAISCLCSNFNIDIVRVHNVKLNYQILKVADRIYRK